MHFATSNMWASLFPKRTHSQVHELDAKTPGHKVNKVNLGTPSQKPTKPKKTVKFAKGSKLAQTIKSYPRTPFPRRTDKSAAAGQPSYRGGAPSSRNEKQPPACQTRAVEQMSSIAEHAPSAGPARLIRNSHMVITTFVNTDINGLSTINVKMTTTMHDSANNTTSAHISTNGVPTRLPADIVAAVLALPVIAGFPRMSNFHEPGHHPHRDPTTAKAPTCAPPTSGPSSHAPAQSSRAPVYFSRGTQTQEPMISPPPGTKQPVTESIAAQQQQHHRHHRHHYRRSQQPQAPPHGQAFTRSDEPSRASHPLSSKATIPRHHINRHPAETGRDIWFDAPQTRQQQPPTRSTQTQPRPIPPMAPEHARSAPPSSSSSRRRFSHTPPSRTNPFFFASR